MDECRNRATPGQNAAAGRCRGCGNAGLDAVAAESSGRGQSGAGSRRQTRSGPARHAQLSRDNPDGDRRREVRRAGISGGRQDQPGGGGIRCEAGISGGLARRVAGGCVGREGGRRGRSRPCPGPPPAGTTPAGRRRFKRRHPGVGGGHPTEARFRPCALRAGRRTGAVRKSSGRYRAPENRGPGSG